MKRAITAACFSLVNLALAVTVCPAEVQLEILNPDAVVSATAQGNVLYIRPKGGAAKSLQASLLQLKSDDGTPLALNIVTFAPDPTRSIASDTVHEIPLRIDASGLPRAGTYSGLAQINALDASGAAVKSVTWSFKCIRPPIEVKFADGDGLHMLLARRWPFTGIAASVPLSYRTTPGEAKPTISFDSGALSRTVGTTKYQVPAALVEAKTDPTHAGLANVSMTLPPLVKDATGTLRARSRELKADVDIPVVVAVKDCALWPLLVVFLGQLLSFRIARWVSKDRQALLNGMVWQQVSDDLDTLLALRRNLANHPNRETVVELLRRARRQGEAGDLEAARTTLVSAQAKLDELRALPLPQAQPAVAAAPPAPRVEILDSPAARVVDRLLQFTISNPSPAWTQNDTVAWTSTRDQGAPVALSTSSEPHTLARFRQPGAYTVGAEVQNQAIAPAAFQVLVPPKLPALARITSVDNAISILAVLIAAAISYIAIDRMESFGTLPDYILAFVGGFGINETLKGFGPVLAKLRGN